LTDEYSTWLFLGVALIILASIEKITKILKAFLIFYGLSAACIFFSIISFGLIVYSLFIKLFGKSCKNVWVANGTIILIQFTFLIGAIGSMVLIAKKRVNFEK
jgi:hypothetical protein